MFCYPQAHVISVVIKSITEMSADRSRGVINQTTECLLLTFSPVKLMVSLPLTAGDRESDPNDKVMTYLKIKFQVQMRITLVSTVVSCHLQTGCGG